MFSRRKFIAGVVPVVIAGKAVAATQYPKTPSQFAGPYYPKESIPFMQDLTRFQGQAAQGDRMVLSGRVVDVRGNPVPDVVLEIWQCDHNGIYRHPRDSKTEQIDTGFAGFAATQSQQDGAYQFMTIVPVPYTGRPPHIHARLHQNDKEILTTQIYLDGQEKENGFFFRVAGSLYGDRSLLTIQPQLQGENYQAVFDFVI